MGVIRPRPPPQRRLDATDAPMRTPADGLSSAGDPTRRVGARDEARLRRPDTRTVTRKRQQRRSNTEGSSSPPAWQGSPADRGGARAERGAGISIGMPR